MPHDRSINFLLRKYETKQPGEAYTSDEVKQEYNNTKWRLSQKIRICDNIINRLNINGRNKDLCHNIIKNIPLKQLHGNASCETIITGICFYVKRLENSNVKIEDYKVCNEYGLTYQNYSLIVGRLCDYYRKNSYMK